MKKIFILICIPLVVFFVLEFDNISLLLATSSQNMQYYLGKEDTIMRYNNAVLLAKDRQYREAKDLLEPLINQSGSIYSADVYELYGDLIYETRGNSGDSIVFYNQSLEHLDSVRVRRKLEILSSSDIDTDNSNNSQSTGTIDTSQDQDDITLRQQRRQEISQNTQYRSSIRDISHGMVDPQDIISRTLDILNPGSVIPKDW